MECHLDMTMVAKHLQAIGGVVGVVLGGSRARGTHSPDSDYDIGVYYSDEQSLDLNGVAKAAAQLDDDHRDGLIAPPGGWGHWVNGGGWLTVEGRPVDIILRDIRRVERAVEDCLAGRIDAHYQTGHPHAYINIMYAGELSISKILGDSGGKLRLLRQKTIPYPEELKKAIIHLFGFEMGFSLMLAAKNIGKGDEYYVAAHVARSLSCLNQVLFALNRQYCLNEKKAVPMIDGFSLKPKGYAARVADIVAQTGNDDTSACRDLELLISETRALCGDAAITGDR